MENTVIQNEQDIYAEFRKRMTASAAKAQIKKLEYNVAAAAIDTNSAKRACAEAVNLGLGAVCVLPCHVKSCSSYLSASNGHVTLVACVSYPSGGDTTDIKVKAVKRAVKDGASEVEVTAPLHYIKDGNFSKFKREMKKLKKAVKDKALRIDAECINLSTEELIKVCKTAADCGITALKTSSDLMGAGKDGKAIAAMKAAVKDRCTIKAEGIQTVFEMTSANDMGAEVIGSNNAPEIARQILTAAEK